MKNYIFNKFALLTLCLVMTLTAFVQAGYSQKSSNIRIGLAGIKIGAVGEGMNSQELAGAIQNTLGDYFKGSKVELVPLESKLASAMEEEAKGKSCAFVLYTTVSHKKGGSGGLGMLKTLAPVITTVVPVVGLAGGMAGAIASSAASSAVGTAAGASSNVKAKDELMLDIKLQNGSTIVMTNQYKAKAKSGGEDLISPLIEQAVQAIVDSVVK